MKESWKCATVYQIYPKSFCDSNGDGFGDIQGIIGKLDYLEQLGIGAVWLTPIYLSPQIDNGYDISDYYQIDPMFGTKEDFLELLSQAHRRGIRIIMDIVINHTSTEHPWFQKAFVEGDEGYRNYYIVRRGKDGGEPNNWKSFFGGSAWEKIKEEDFYYLHLFAKEQADLNWECEALRRDVMDMMRYWLNLGVDGFRLDVINLISKEQTFSNDFETLGTPGKKFYINGPEIHSFLKEINREVFTPFQALTVGETMDATVEDGAIFTKPGNHELDMIFSMEHMEVDYQDNDRWTVKETDFLKLKSVLSIWQMKLEEEGGWNSLFWSNHDQPRVVSRFGHEGRFRRESAKMLATVLHMLKGTPYVYQGEEFGMINPGYETIEEYCDIETWNVYRERIGKGVSEADLMAAIKRQSRDNARSPMQWNGSEGGGFSRAVPWMKMGKSSSRIHAQEDMARPDSIFSYYQKLIGLRKTEELVREGVYRQLDQQDKRVWAYLREEKTYSGECAVGNREQAVGKTDALLIIGNFYGERAQYSLPELFLEEYKIVSVLLSNYEREAVPDKVVDLKEYEAAVYRCVRAGGLKYD